MNQKPTYEELEKTVSDLESKVAAIQKESSQKLRIISDYAHSWEYWIGPNSKQLLYVSPSCENHTGYSQKEFMERNDLLFEIIHPEDKAIISDHFKHNDAGPSVESIVFRIVDKRGEVRWISHFCQAIFDSNGVFLGRRASNNDVTEQKQAEKDRDDVTENLKRTSSLLNTVLDAIPDIIGVQELDHTIIRYNQAGYKFLNMTPSDAHGKKCYELIGHKEPCNICATTKVYKTKQPAQVEKYVEEIDKWLDVRAYPIFDADGNLNRIIEHLRDISKEKDAEIRLKEAHERLITILNSIDAHIYVADIESYEVLFVNLKMTEDFKFYSTGQKCYQAFRNKSEPCEHCTNHKLLDENQKPTGVHIWQDKNPVTGCWYLNCDRAINWIDGRVVRIQIAMDISVNKKYEEDRKLMEQQLLQAQKMEAIGTLAGGIAHDFNNILSGIFGFSQLAKNHLKEPEKAKKDIDQIIKGAQKATELVQQILAASRKTTYEKQPVSVHIILKEALKLLRATIPTTIEIEEDVVSKANVMSDPVKIHQIIMNLCTNAYQAMNETKGCIFVRLKEVILSPADCISELNLTPGLYLDLEISDTGHGMDSTTLEKIFDPYFTTKESGKGTGLGLAVVFGIVKECKGHISVQSAVGKGSTFHVYLPIVNKSDSAVAPAEENKASLYGEETIMFVDDEEALRDVVQSLLEGLGYIVYTYSNGIIAFENYNENPSGFDLVVTDMTMPGLTGLELSQKILELRPTQAIILCTGYSEKIDRMGALAMGITDYFEKPFIVTELAKTIRKVLDEAKS